MTAPSPLHGILAMVASAGLLTLNDAVSKHLAQSYPIGQVICLRQLAAFLFILPYALATSGLYSLRPVYRGGQFLRALLFAAGAVLVLWSLMLLPLSFVLAILFATPFFVAIISAPMLGERVSAHQWGAIAAGFVGVLLIVRPGGGFGWIVLLPLGAALINAVRDTFTRRLTRTDRSIAILFWSGVMIMAAGLATVPWGWQPVDVRGAVWYLAAGAFNASAHFMMIEAFRMGHAAVISPFHYTGLLWAILIGYLVWGEVPDAWMLTGAAVVVASGIYMIRRGVPGR